MTTGLTGGLFMFKDLYTTPGKKCSSSLVSNLPHIILARTNSANLGSAKDTSP